MSASPKRLALSIVSAKYFPSLPSLTISNVLVVRICSYSFSLTARKTRVKPGLAPIGGAYPVVVNAHPLYCSNPFLLQLDVQGQPTNLVGQHIEAGRRAGFERVFAFDHRLVDLGPAFHVIALDREQLLEDVGGAVGLERPYFHFAEALAAEACLAAEGL